MTKIILASEVGIPLDSDVHSGGGTDATDLIQKILDLALEGGVRLILDGAALVRGVRVHSNTTIECLDKSCGLYLADHSDCPLISNSQPNEKELQQRNIRIIGGTFNHNCRGQKHMVPCPERIFEQVTGEMRWVTTFEFHGVENMLIRDVTIVDQRSFAMLILNWKNVTIEDIIIELPNRMQAQNQDGINIWGPGQYLFMRNITIRSGDDLIAITPDQLDGVSSITDVLIDGVFADHADQCIRLLSRGTGRLDRVTIRNVSGVYRSFGFYINPWFVNEECGNFGNIFIENVDLRNEDPNYTYTPPMLFRIGGNIEYISFKNIRHHNPHDGRTLFEVGVPYCNVYDGVNLDLSCAERQKIGTIMIDGLSVSGTCDHIEKEAFIKIFDDVDTLILRDFDIITNGRKLIEYCSGNIAHLLSERIFMC